jgi:hypothetical protein
VKEFTDTERLKWLLNHSPDRDFEWRTNDYWIIWYDYSKGYKQKVIARGKSWIECIDNALADTFEILKY